jgi:hypothetical protein
VQLERFGDDLERNVSLELYLAKTTRKKVQERIHKLSTILALLSRCRATNDQHVNVEDKMQVMENLLKMSARIVATPRS